MQTYYPPGTKVYVAAGDLFGKNQYYHCGEHLITNKIPPEPWKVEFENPADFVPPVPTGRGSDLRVFDDMVYSPEDGPLSAVHNAREQLKEAMTRGNGTQIGEARMAVDRAERQLREYWERVKTDDTRKDEPIIEARVETELSAAAVDIAESDLRQTLAATPQE